MVGEGPGKKDVIRFLDKYPTRLKYIGVLKHKKLLKLLSKSDIFVNLSSLEGLSTTIMEAMYLGMFIIASDIAPNREILKEYRNKSLISVSNNIQLDFKRIIKRMSIRQDNAIVFTLKDAVSHYLKIYESFLSP